MDGQVWQQFRASTVDDVRAFLDRLETSSPEGPLRASNAKIVWTGSWFIVWYR